MQPDDRLPWIGEMERVEAADSNVPAVVIAEHAAALEEYCAALMAIAKEVNADRVPSAEQLSLAQSAKLRLENAKTLVEICIEAPEIAATWIERRRGLGASTH
jgi:hypothetical protein